MLLINKWQGGGVPCRDYQGSLIVRAANLEQVT
jgi:hypothetical protein